MADLAASAVTILDNYFSDGGNGKKFRTRKVRLVLTTQGGATNKIPAEVLNLTSIESATPAVASDNSLVIVAAPSYDKTFLLLKAAGTNAPADYNGITVELVVKGN